ncbi:hypothetical protein FHX34_102937 [Actinoplanes teichomyceticus]|uniref:Uncharacterized protein n=1 Tax=Actinoplanes teichomyceticus TaxID=1867 RepID=A0A561WKI7_ACTTI|nr:hypothetical protein FHX34_102937 [Actinoplanes teichomyceticus]GIF12767.1 hypothetical protein Ate01nite_27990 [Actinoplanes teichomyceticus]
MRLVAHDPLSLPYQRAPRIEPGRNGDGGAGRHEHVADAGARARPAPPGRYGFARAFRPE